MPPWILVCFIVFHISPQDNRKAISANACRISHNRRMISGLLQTQKPTTYLMMTFIPGIRFSLMEFSTLTRRHMPMVPSKTGKLPEMPPLAVTSVYSVSGGSPLNCLG